MRSHKDIIHEGTLGDDGRRRMTFDEDSISHIMSILTDLYSDPMMAVIREYSTNAWDSHLAAENPDPIKVTVPTGMNPLFVVEDNGVGMSEEDILEHFSKYGWSSKRETDEQVGMLGLGCKSALTLVSQFTIIATQDKTQLTVLVTRDQDGAGAVQIIDKQENVDEPNGVTIQIPVGVGKVEECRSKAEYFFSFWEKGQVLVNGKDPVKLNDSDIVLDPDVIVTDRQEISRDVIIMGNVPYPILVDNDDGKWRGFGQYDDRRGVSTSVRIVARVPIGAVDFTPAREELHMTNRTKDVIETLYAFVKNRMHALAQKSIDACVDHPSAQQKATAWENAFGRRNHYITSFTYKGDKIPVLGVWQVTPPNQAFRWHLGYKNSINSPSERCDILTRWNQDSCLFVVGNTSRGIPKSLKQAILSWNKVNPKRARPSVIVCKKDPFGPWLSDDDRKKIIVHISEFDKYRPPPSKGGGKHTATITYRLLDEHGTYHTMDHGFPLKGKEIIWTEPKRHFETVLSRGVFALLSADKRNKFGATKNSEIVLAVLRKKEWNAFMKKHKNAVYIENWVRNQRNEVERNMTPELAREIKNGKPYTNFTLLNPDRVLDPELATFIRSCSGSNDKLAFFNDISDLCRALRISLPVLPDVKNNEQQLRIRNLNQHYPLVKAFYRPRSGREAAFTEWLLEYVNSMHVVRSQIRPPTF